MTPLITLENLSKYYINGQNVVTGLDKVDLTLYAGEFVAVTGESGSGKSTLAHILGGILPYEDGELYVCGKPTSHYDRADWETYRREKVAFISQNYEILPGATVLDHVVSALLLTGLDREAAEEKTRENLEEVELWEFRSRRAAKLSSGQKQRLSIARALAKPCPILIADEPTGNLDPENSRKVIDLLAKAAKERLVILVTHEFSEAENLVTRHIRVHDGRIVSDARLRPVPERAPGTGCQTPSGKLGRYFAGLQLRSRPVWSGMVLAFFVLTAFAVFAFLGSFIVALDDTSTRIYQTDAFLDGSKDRIVAVRKDGQVMTEADYDAILGLDHVESLERYGYAADFCYSYRQNEDYTRNYAVRNYGGKDDPLYVDVVDVELRYAGQFVHTVPLSGDDDSFLTVGRLPESFREVISADPELEIGQELTVYLTDFRNWSAGAYIEFSVTVVGTTERGSGLYFHDDVARMLTLNFLGAEYTYMPVYEDVLTAVNYEEYYDRSQLSLAESLYGAEARKYYDPFLVKSLPTEASELRPIADGETLISLSQYGALKDVAVPEVAGPTALYDAIYAWGVDTGAGKLYAAGLHESTYANLLGVSPAYFSEYLDAHLEGCGDQVSITIQDYAYTDRVITALEKAGYYALSPYVVGSAQVDPELAAQREQTLTVCLGAMAAVMLLQFIVLRTLFGMQTESWRILSNVGLPFRTAKTALLLQILLFTLLGQALGLGGILLCSGLGIQRIESLTRYLDTAWWLVLSGVHLASALICAWGIIRTLRKRVYPQSERYEDLEVEV